MAKHGKFPVSRRRFIGGTTALAGALGFSAIARAQPKTVKVGCIHPVTGFVAYQRHAGPRRRADGDRGHQQGGRHQVDGRRQARGAARRRAVQGRGRRQRSREDERSRRGRLSSAASRAPSASPPRRRRPSTTRLSWSMSARPTRSSSRGLKNTFRFAAGLRHLRRPGVADAGRAQQGRRQRRPRRR